MSKRFTDSTKFRDRWYRKLSPKMKCLWEYLLAECDLSGLLDYDLDAMEFHIGEEITMDDLLSLGSHIYFLNDDKIFIPKFVEFQQGSLNPDNRAHKAIFSSFEKYGIPTDLNMENFTSPLDAPLKPLIRGQGIGNSKGIGNGVVMVNDENLKKNEELDICINLYNDVASKYDLSKVQKLTKARKSKLKARLKDCDGIEGWKYALAEIEQSDFLRGLTSTWKVTFDFLLSEEKFTKIMEGCYRNNDKKKGGKNDAMLDGFLKA